MSGPRRDGTTHTGGVERCITREGWSDASHGRGGRHVIQEGRDDVSAGYELESQKAEQEEGAGGPRAEREEGAGGPKAGGWNKTFYKRNY